MLKLSARAMSLQESAIRKLDLTVREQTDVTFHRLNIGQPDVATPEPLLTAIRGFDAPVLRYGPASGMPSTRQAAAAYHSRWTETPLEERHVAVTTGGSEALLFAFTAICDPGDEILVPEPYYTNYNGFATLAGARIRPIRTSFTDGFALPSDAELDAFITDRTKAFVFSNPGNPTGVVYSRSEVERLLAWCQRRGLLAIADEVYRRIWFDQPPTSALQFPEYADNVVIIDSMSKTFSACGLRLGFFVSTNEVLMEKVERLGQARLGAQPLAQVAAEAALAMDESYYEDVRATYRARVDAMTEGLLAIDGVSAYRPAGAFYTMVKLPVADSEAFARWLVTDFRHEGESLVVAPGPGFYSDPSFGRDEIRLAAVLNERDLAHAIGLLGHAVAAYRG